MGRGRGGENGRGGGVCLMNARPSLLLLTEIIQLVRDIIHARLGYIVDTLCHHPYKGGGGGSETNIQYVRTRVFTICHPFSQQGIKVCELFT